MDVIDGRFELAARLGEGADAEVFEAIDRRSVGRRAVALKLLRAGAVAPLRSEALRLEFRLLSQVRHVNLVEVFDFGRDPKTGRYYYTMECVPGACVDESLDGAPLETVLDASIAIAAALEHLHDAGFVHGDLKASNVRRTPEGEVRVVDAGLAAAIGSTTGVSGTALFLAPERLAGDAVDARCDLYALGVLLYLLLLGRHPFEGSTTEVLRAHRRDEPKPPRSIRPDLPWGLQALVLALLSKDPAERPGSARVVRRRLEGLRRRESLEPLVIGRPRIGPLVGCGMLVEKALHRLRSALALPGRRKGAEGPCVLFFEGEPGIGKSRLLSEIRARLQVEGVRPAEAAFPLRGGFPFLRDASGVEAEAPGPWVRAVLDRAAKHPVVFLLDDVHQEGVSDDPVVRRLVESVLIEAAAGSTARVAIVATGGRETDLPATVERQSIEPLSMESVRTLATALSRCTVDERAARKLHASTGGNPYLVESVVLAPPGTAGDPSAIDLPAALEHTLGSLRVAARDVLDVLALAGEADAKGLAAALEVTVEETWGILRGLEQRAVLGRQGDRFRFAHGLLADSVRAGLGPKRRRDLVERWTDGRDEGDPDRVRLRLEVGLPVGGEAVLAAESLQSRGQPGAALELLRQAEKTATSPSQGLLERTAVLALDLAGPQVALDVLARLEGSVTTDPVAQARRARLTGNALYLLQEFDAARLRFERATRLLEGRLGTVEHVKLEGSLASLDARSGRLDEALARTEVMERLADDAGLPLEAAIALGKRAVILVQLERFLEVAPLLEECLTRFSAADDEIGQQMTTYNLGHAYTILGDVERAAGLYARALDAAVEQGAREREATARTWLASVLVEHGALGEARRHLDRARTIERALGLSASEGRLVRARLLWLSGEPGVAMRLLERVLEDADSGVWSGVARARLSQHRLAIGDSEGAMPLARAARLDLEGSAEERWWGVAALAAVEGDAEALTALADRLEQQGRRTCCAEVHLLRAARLPDARSEACDRAARALTGTGARCLEARLHLLGGGTGRALGLARKCDLQEILWRGMARSGTHGEEGRALAEAWAGDLEYEDQVRVAEDPDLRALRAALPRTAPGETREEVGMRDGDRLRALTEICDAVGVLQDLDALLRRTLDVVVQHLGVERVIVFLWNPETQALEPRARRGALGTDLVDATSVSGSALTQALEGGGILHVGDTGADGEEADPSRSMVHFGIRSLFAAPILLRSRPVGVIYGDNRTDPLAFGPADLAFVEAIAKQIGVAVENARVHGRVRGEAEAMKRTFAPIVREIRDRYSVRNLIGDSPAFRQVLDLVDRLKTGHTSVLLLGENGTGKELIARTVHYQSDRQEKPFVALNCAALPESLLESELFGIEKGVASGVEQRTGRFEDADGGTLFLDEIGDMSAAVQAKVLRVLQERTFERVGGKRTIPVDVRVIAATSRDLEAMVAESSFRKDLYYRLAVFPIRLPPLRNRREDVPDLARHFLATAALEHDKGSLSFSNAAVDALTHHDWPGNVRELQNVIERAVLLTRSDVLGVEPFAGALPTAGASPAALTGCAPGTDGVDAALLALPYDQARTAALERFDRAYVERALQRTAGNVSHAARAAGLRRQRLYEIMRRAGIRAEAHRP